MLNLFQHLTVSINFTEILKQVQDDDIYYFYNQRAIFQQWRVFYFPFVLDYDSVVLSSFTYFFCKKKYVAIAYKVSSETNFYLENDSQPHSTSTYSLELSNLAYNHEYKHKILENGLGGLDELFRAKPHTLSHRYLVKLD